VIPWGQLTYVVPISPVIPDLLSSRTVLEIGAGVLPTSENSAYTSPMGSFIVSAEFVLFVVTLMGLLLFALSCRQYSPDEADAPDAVR
jgi:hypothetical protein